MVLSFLVKRDTRLFVEGEKRGVGIGGFIERFMFGIKEGYREVFWVDRRVGLRL